MDLAVLVVLGTDFLEDSEWGGAMKELQILLYIFYNVKSQRSFENLELRFLCFLRQASVKFASTTLCSLDHSSTKD